MNEARHSNPMLITFSRQCGGMSMPKKAVKIKREFKGEKTLEEIIKEYIDQVLKRQC